MLYYVTLCYIILYYILYYIIWRVNLSKLSSETSFEHQGQQQLTAQNCGTVEQDAMSSSVSVFCRRKVQNSGVKFDFLA